MPKPQSGADKNLINAGLALAKQKGLSGFSVRELCSKAKVNPGLFHYYFTTRENFNKAVLKELYSELLKDIEVGVPKDMSPKEKLVAIQLLIGKFTKNNSSLLSSVIIDVASGNKEILSFIKDNFTHHIKLAVSIIEECKKEGIVENTDTLSLLFTFVAPVVIPNVVAGVFAKVLDKKEAEKMKPLRERILSEEAIKERERLSLKAVLK